MHQHMHVDAGRELLLDDRSTIHVPAGLQSVSTLGLQRGATVRVIC